MKHLLHLMLALTLAISPVGLADSHSGKIVNGLLQLGARAVQAEQQRRADKQAARQEASPGQPDVAGNAAVGTEDGEDEAKRTWKDRGKDMLGAFVARGKEGLGEAPLGKLVGQALKEAMDVVVDEYKEQYKDEGRRYAKELGDKVVERVREDPKISSSITSVKILCWVVIAYLTIVTLVMLFSLLHLKKINRRLLEKLDASGRQGAR